MTTIMQRLRKDNESLRGQVTTLRARIRALEEMLRVMQVKPGWFPMPPRRCADEDEDLHD